jgi:hypothetical protein
MSERAVAVNVEVEVDRLRLISWARLRGMATATAAGRPRCSATFTDRFRVPGTAKRALAIGGAHRGPRVADCF